MCGIFLHWKDNLKNINNYEQDLQLLGKMKHRGPDAQEIVIKDNTLLGFNRLAIREIVEGNQPYLSKEGRFISCINGELYNDVQVRKRLQIDFPKMSLPKGDMQLLAELISIKGIEGLKLADGMFAGFIYHYEVSKLVLFRDKMGEKPIFYCEMGDDFYVASEIRSLPVKHLSQSDNFQRGLVRGFWAGGETFYSNIMKVSPGTLIEVDLKSKARKVSKFWSWDSAVVSNKNKKSQFVRGGSKEELSRIFSDGIRQSVASQLASEVPVAAFLSGGLDSAAVVKASAECLGKPLPTFTLRFEGIPNKEHKIAEATARFLKSEHQIIRVNDAELPELIKQSIGAMDWPILDPACIGIFALSHEISKKGFKVALTGDGGDELFRGYKVFSYLRLMAIAMKIPNVSKFVLENALKFNIKEKNYLGFHMLGSRMRQVMISSNFSVPEIAISPFSGSEILEELLPKSTEKMREISSLQEMTSNFENYYRSFVLPELYLQKATKCRWLTLLKSGIHYWVLSASKRSVTFWNK